MTHDPDNRPRSPRTFLVWGSLPALLGDGWTYVVRQRERPHPEGGKVLELEGRITAPRDGTWTGQRFEVVCQHAEDARRCASELRAAGFVDVGWKGAESQGFPRRKATDEDGPGFPGWTEGE